MSHEASPFTLGTTVRGKIYRILIPIFAVLLLCTVVFFTYSQRTLVEESVSSQATTLADSYFDNINTLMLTGGMANQEIARNKLLSRPEVIDARIMRSEAFKKIHGPGGDHTKPIDEFDERALKGELIKTISEGEKGRVLSVLIPLPASENFRATNCVGCHPANTGEMLGAVRVDYDMSELDAAVNQDIITGVAINSVLVVISLVLLGTMFSRVVSNPLCELTQKMREVAEGNADWSQKLHVTSEDEIGALANYFNMAIGKFGGIIEDTKRQSDAATRLKTALDCVSTNVMVADKDYNIIYMNNAVQSMFRQTEKDLRERLPQFNAHDLIGNNIDIFHENPAHQRSLLDGLSDTYESRVEVGELTFRIIANPVINEAGERLGTAVEWADLTAELKAAAEEAERLEEERRQATENLRIRTALDNVSSSVMVADEDYNIIYLNKELHRMFSEAEAGLREALPNFDANTMLGSNMDVFHKDPSHQRRLLDHMRGTVSNEIQVADLTLKVVANPVLNSEGERLGTVVEWSNRTEEVAVEHEIDTIVASAKNGDLGQRIAMEGKQGFFKQLGSGINQLVDVVDNVFVDIAAAMGHIAQGNLTQPITNDYAGTFGKVKSDVNTTIDNLEDIIRQLRDSADNIKNGSQEITAGNNNLSARTEQQASSLEETAASMEELTSTVRNNADNAQQAKSVATNASNLATQGGEVVGRAIEAMDEINKSSGQIAEIINVIDEIAFQTNLLALNASVEAARAGEQGRGFAVVATEVRNLAGRAATSAKEIKELIQDSVTKVKAGSELVNESGQTLEEIVTGVKKVSDIIAEIAAASAEQSAGIDQVNQAVTAMDEAVQQNAALAEQTSAASASVSSKATEMDGLVSFFNVSGGKTVSTRPAATVAPARAAISQPQSRPAAAAKPRPVQAAPAVPQMDDDDEWEEF